MFNDLQAPKSSGRNGEEAVTNTAPATTDHWYDSLRKPVTAMLGATALLGCEARLNAGITPDGVDPAIALKEGEKYGSNKGFLHFKYEYDDPTQPGGRRTKYAGAVLGKSGNVAFTAAHVIDDGLLDRNLKAWVGTCTNYNEPQGPWYEVKSFKLFPGWVSEASRSSIPDIAALVLHEKVTTAVAPVVASQPTPQGQNVVYCGTGGWGSPSMGQLNPRDGNIRAGVSEVYTMSLLGESTYFHQSTLFDNVPGNFSGLRPTPGYSGSPVFNTQGQLIGIMSYGNSGLIAAGAGYLKTTIPEVKAFMDSFIIDIPDAPPELTLRKTDDGIELSWDTDGTWRLQSSNSLSEQSWTDVALTRASRATGVITLRIASAELQERGFFRLIRNSR